MNRICESEQHLYYLSNIMPLDHLTRSYISGDRSQIVLNGLALGRVYSRNIGIYITPPRYWDQTTWDDVLDKLVQSRLGTHRCLDCNCFLDSRVSNRCQCGSTAMEPVGCTEGIV